MANTVTTLTTMANLLKNVYAPQIEETTKRQVVTLELLETKLGQRSPWGGNGFIIPLEVNQMHSYGSRSENGNLPDARPTTWLQTTVPIYSHYFTISATGLSMAATKNNDSAWADAWSRSAYIATRSYRQHLNRMLNGNGTAILCQVDGSISIGGTYTTITMDNAYGVSTEKNSAINGGKFLSTNMLLDFMTSSTVRDEGACPVVTLTPGSGTSTSAYATFTNSYVDSVADGDYVYVTGNYGKELPGLELLADDGTLASTFQSLNCSTYSDWQAVVHYGSSPGTAEQWSTARMMNFVDDLESLGGMNIAAYKTSNALWLTVGEIMRNEGYVVNPEVLDTGYTVIKFNGVPIYKDPYSMATITAIDPGVLKIYEAAPQGWLETDGGVIERDHSSGYQRDNYVAFYGWYMTPGISNRKRIGKMVDITNNVWKSW